MRIEIVTPIVFQKSTEYALVFTDATGYTFYFNEDGSYDGHSHDPDKCKWAGSKVECLLCTHKWFAVFPANCDKLECPNCHNMAEYDYL